MKAVFEKISEASKLVAALCVCELEHSMELALGAL